MAKNTNGQERLYQLAFNQFSPLGPQGIKRLQKHFPGLEEAFRAPMEELLIAGLKRSLTDAFCSWRKNFSVDKLLECLAQEGINFITWDEKEYPALLKEIYAPPPVIYYRGKWPRKGDCLAVVGSRQPSPYANLIINQLLPPVITAEIIIVSGLALGVDTLAHRAALTLKGITWAILGSGLGAADIYPRENRRLATEIIAGDGALISEFSPGTPPYKQNFPRRNRLIAGLSRAVLVIEAAKKSGALITARKALEQNREVLAVPGNIFSAVSLGTNQLIKDGAATITSPEDILEIFGKETTAGQQFPNSGQHQEESLADNEKTIHNLIRNAAENSFVLTADEIIKKTKLDTATVNSTLSILEIKGFIKQAQFGYSLN